MSNRSRFALTGFAIFFLGCGDGVRDPGAVAQGGDDPVILDAEDLRRVGGSDSIAVVRDLAVLPDGTVWALNSVEPLFVGFGPEGAVSAAYGRSGGGPDEFGLPAGFVAGGLDGEAWALDRRRHSLIRISGPEAARREIALPRDAIAPGSVMTGLSLTTDMVRTAFLGGEVVLPRRTETGEFAAISAWMTMWNAELVAFDPEAGAVRSVVSLSDVMGDLEAHFASVSAGFPPFPLWNRLWAVCGDAEVRLYDFVRDELLGFAADGAELDPLPVAPPFMEVSPREFALAAFDLAAAERAGAVMPGVADMTPADSAKILDGVVGRLQGTPAQLAALLPEFVDFRCGEDGTMWLRPLDLERGGLRGGPLWRRIDPAGHARDVRFPDRFDPLRFTNGRIWGVQRDEFDRASIAWIEAPIGG